MHPPSSERFNLDGRQRQIDEDSEKRLPEIVTLVEDTTHEDLGISRLCSPHAYSDIVFGGLAGGERITPHVVQKDGVAYLRIPLGYTRSGKGHHFARGKTIKLGSKWRWAVNDIEVQGCPKEDFEGGRHQAAYLNAPALFLVPEGIRPVRAYNDVPFVYVGELILRIVPSGQVRVVEYRHSLCFKLTEYSQFCYSTIRGNLIPTPLHIYCDPLGTIFYTPTKLTLVKH